MILDAFSGCGGPTQRSLPDQWQGNLVLSRGQHSLRGPTTKPRSRHVAVPHAPALVPFPAHQASTAQGNRASRVQPGPGFDALIPSQMGLAASSASRLPYGESCVSGACPRRAAHAASVRQYVSTPVHAPADRASSDSALDLAPARLDSAEQRTRDRHSIRSSVNTAPLRAIWAARPLVGLLSARTRCQTLGSMSSWRPRVCNSLLRNHPAEHSRNTIHEACHCP